MMTVQQAGNGSSVSTDLADVGRMSVGGEASGLDGDFAADFERRLQLQLLSFGITTLDHESSGPANIAQSATRAAVGREHILTALNPQAETAPELDAEDIALPAPSGPVQPEKCLHHSPTGALETSAVNDVRLKKSDKAESEMLDSPEVKGKRRGSKLHLQTQDLAKQDTPAAAALFHTLDPKPDSVPPAGRAADPELLKRQDDPNTRPGGIEQPEAMGGAVANPRGERKDASEMQAFSKVLPCEHQVETKSPAALPNNDRSVMESTSSQVTAAADFDGPKKPAHTEGSESFTGSHLRGSNSASTLEPTSAVPNPMRRSQSRNGESRTHTGDSRAALMGTGIGVAGDICRSAFSEMPKDQTISGIQRHLDRSTSEITDESSRTLDLPLRHSEQQWIHVGPHLAEAGFQDDSLGWISVRAARDPAGLHAVLVPPSVEAERTLSGHLNGLNAYLGDNQIQVSAVTLSAFQDGRLGSSFGANGQQQNAREESDERKPRRQKDAFKVELASVSSRASSQSDLDRYESLSFRSRNINSGETHISLVA